MHVKDGQATGLSQRLRMRHVVVVVIIIIIIITIIIILIMVMFIPLPVIIRVRISYAWIYEGETTSVRDEYPLILGRKLSDSSSECYL